MIKTIKIFTAVFKIHFVVDPWHLEAAGNVWIAKEGDTEERRQLLKQFATACKSDGALALVQLTHAGRQTAANVNQSPFSASFLLE